VEHRPSHWFCSGAKIIVLFSMSAAAEIRPVLSEAEDEPEIRNNSEFDLLVACCSLGAADRIRKILSRPLDWHRMLALVDYHRVVPQVYGELSALSHLVPAQPLDALRSRYQDNARKALWFTAELVRILGHLESAGIEALPFKGPVLAETLYGEVTQRQFGDLDILILPADVPKAKAALLGLGYACEPDLRPTEEPAYIASGCGYVFHSSAGRNLLDLQWRIVPRFYSIDFEVADFFKRAKKIDLGTRAMEDGRPSPSLPVADRIATQPSKKSSEVSWDSREAAPECSPRRKPWVESKTPPSPGGAKEALRPNLDRLMRTLRAEDLLLVLCVHAAKHVWIQLSWLCDIAQLAKSRQLDWTAIQDEARRLGIERIVNLNLLLAHKLLGSPLPPATQKRSLRSANDPQPNCHSERSEESAVGRNCETADEILRIIERSTHYDTESLPYFRLMMRLRERRRDRARFLWRLAVTPSVSEWSAVHLPKPLQPLYRLVRLSRLIKRFASAG
jgi:hypothetical protein